MFQMPFMFQIYVPDLCSGSMFRMPFIYIQAARRGQGGLDGQDGPPTLQNDEKLKFDKGIDEGTTREKSGWDFLQSGQSVFRLVFVWFSYGFIMFSYGFNRPPLVGPSAVGLVFVWFSYGLALFSYGSNRPLRRSIGFRDRFRMVILWFCNAFVWF